jgi:hypothetical protein
MDDDIFKNLPVWLVPFAMVLTFAACLAAPAALAVAIWLPLHLLF